MTKENEEEKSSGLWSKVASGVMSAAGSVASAIGLSGRGKDDGIIDVDDDSLGPVVGDGEELSEVLFQSLVESCPDDSVVVRLVRVVKLSVRLIHLNS